ncbi:MAG: DUF2357 domain-containing protein [Chitinispirillales bacterium]|jgi:hypothetical protein|nr:DUF2357 domain-containing protein [Chitinispirillales bacterium]
MLNKPALPNKIDYIINGETDKLSPAQVLWYDLLRAVDSFYFCLNNRLELTQRLQRGYNHTTLSRYINEIAAAAEETACVSERPLRHDEFTQIALKALPAIEKIVINPRTRLVKESCKQHVSRVREVSHKTVEWLAQRPQEKIEDKIKPNNTVLTRKTVFSPDTVENRALRYFYGRLYKYISMLVEKSECADCGKRDGCSRVSELQGFLWIKNAMRKTGLNDVREQVAAVPNNALLCDKYYSVVRRETENMKKVEERIERKWNKLPELLLRMELLIKSADTVGDAVLAGKEVKIFERVVTYQDGVGIVCGGKPVESVKILVKDGRKTVIKTIKIKNDRVGAEEEADV